MWTGDNVANRFYLANTIPSCLGMSLSGLPFCGPDIAGFGGDGEDLTIDWFKADFLFPFFRNHADRNAARKEPWAYGKGTMMLLRRYIRLRYKLLPYLYNLFAEGETTGDPALRPLFYHLDEQGLDTIDDQFMAGPFILQAPFLHESPKTRSAVLPGTRPWYDATRPSRRAPRLRAREPCRGRHGSARLDFADVALEDETITLTDKAPRIKVAKDASSSAV